MSFFFKASAFFIAIFMILSIPLNQKPIFSYLYSWSSPITIDFYEKLSERSRFIWKKGKKFGLRYFSLPEEIEKKSSSHSFNKTPKEKLKQPMSKSIDNSGPYTDEEEEFIRLLHKKSEVQNEENSD